MLTFYDNIIFTQKQIYLQHQQNVRSVTFVETAKKSTENLKLKKKEMTM